MERMLWTMYNITVSKVFCTFQNALTTYRLLYQVLSDDWCMDLLTVIVGSVLPCEICTILCADKELSGQSGIQTTQLENSSIVLFRIDLNAFT